MPTFHCPHCGDAITGTPKTCPHCGQRLSLLAVIKRMVEGDKRYQAGLVVLVVLILGVGGFWRLDSGSRWPLLFIVALLAPLVPWLLKLAYKAAAPVPEEKNEEHRP